jgi:hypothetical protein
MILNLKLPLRVPASLLAPAFVLLALFAQTAPAQCPSIGADANCGILITVTDTGAYLSNTGAGPYDGGEGIDTLVGVINNSSQPIYALGLSSSSPIFAFAGNGIDNYAVQGNSIDTTGYGGPNAYFSSIDPTQSIGSVNFITPIPPAGGTAYFSLAATLTSTTSCSALLNNAVSIPTGGGTSIQSFFTPNFGYSIAAAAKLCGFTNFDWQQLWLFIPTPSPYFDINFNTLYAPPPFNDPPPAGYPTQYPPNAVVLPIYYNLSGNSSDDLALADPLNENVSTLYFYDAPADPCLYGGDNTCGYNAPPGQTLQFSTHLVGIVGVFPNATVQDTGIGFTWTDSFNGTSGGIAVSNSAHPVDPGSGTGGVTVTSVNQTASYQYPKPLVITTVNGKIEPPPAPLALLTATQVSISTSGFAYSRVTKTFNGTVTFKNVSNSALSGPFQLVLLNLSSAATPNAKTGIFGGSPFFTVRGASTLPPGASITVPVQFADPSMAAINFSPAIYSGGFN